MSASVTPDKVLTASKFCVSKFKKLFYDADNSITIDQKKLCVKKKVLSIELSKKQIEYIIFFKKYSQFLHKIIDATGVEYMRELYYNSIDPKHRFPGSKVVKDNNVYTRTQVKECVSLLGIKRDVIPSIEQDVMNIFTKIHINITFIEEVEMLIDILEILLDCLKSIQKKSTRQGLHVRFQDSIDDFNSHIANITSLLDSNAVHSLHIIHSLNQMKEYCENLKKCGKENKVTISELEGITQILEENVDNGASLLCERVITEMIYLDDDSFVKMYTSGITHHSLEKRYTVLMKRRKYNVLTTIDIKKNNDNNVVKAKQKSILNYNEKFELCRITMTHIRNLKKNLMKYKRYNTLYPGFLVMTKDSDKIYLISAVNRSNFTCELVIIPGSTWKEKGSIDILGICTTYCMNTFSTGRGGLCANWVNSYDFTVIQNEEKYNIADDVNDDEMDEFLRSKYSGDTYITEDMEDNYVEYGPDGDGITPWSFSGPVSGGTFLWQILQHCVASKKQESTSDEFVYLFSQPHNRFIRFFIDCVAPMAGDKFSMSQICEAYVRLLEMWFNGTEFNTETCLVEPSMNYLYNQQDLCRFLSTPRKIDQIYTDMDTEDDKPEGYDELLQFEKTVMSSDVVKNVQYIQFELEMLFDQAKRVRKSSQTEYNIIKSQIETLYESVTPFSPNKENETENETE